MVEIEAIEKADAEAQGRPQAQGVLAREVTRLVHGEDGLQAAERITEALFSGDTSSLSEADYQQLAQDGLPASQLPEGLQETPLTTLLSEAGMANSGKQIKDALQREAVIVNGKSVSMADNMSGDQVFSVDAARFERYYLVKLGKKKHHLFVR